MPLHPTVACAWVSNNNNSHDNVYGAVIMTKVIARVHPVHLMNVDSAPGGRQPSDQASRLGLWVRRKYILYLYKLTFNQFTYSLAATSTSTIAIVIITQPVGWYSFYRPTKGGRLSRPKHCSKSAQPVLKTVYRSSCRDEHDCQRRDSNLGPLTPQSDALTTRLLRPVHWVQCTCIVCMFAWIFLSFWHAILASNTQCASLL